MNTVTQPDLATELQYALDVMEEYSHLGLDDERASILRKILTRKIDEAEAALAGQRAEKISA